jgi:hypothetical protein
MVIKTFRIMSIMSKECDHYAYNSCLERKSISKETIPWRGANHLWIMGVVSMKDVNFKGDTNAS